MESDLKLSRFSYDKGDFGEEVVFVRCLGFLCLRENSVVGLGVGFCESWCLCVLRVVF